jgi:hypothetical protein
MLALLPAISTAAAAAPVKPNVLMLAVDDLRPLFGDSFGYPEVRHISARRRALDLCAEAESSSSPRPAGRGPLRPIARPA